MPSPLRRVLIANRGEIAIRIAEAAAVSGTESVAIYVDADERALHTRLADAAVLIPSTPSDPVAGYLDVDAIVGAAVEAGCDAIHPGYGFLSENPALASACEAAGITFIGPPPEALGLFGDKVAARALATATGIPTVPGSSDAVADTTMAASIANDVGFPVVLKASAGGGGRGIRRVDSPSELEEAFERCASEAAAAFGDGTLFVEKLIERPRHIEVQVLVDQAGTAVHLADRDCSVQLRNQKVVEIAPASGLDSALRQTLWQQATELAVAGGIRNAATVEFLVDPDSGAHFFIECNPRIQVEHTVTEEVAGVDLVATQFALAAGQTLGELGITDCSEPYGHAVQARVVATGAGTIAGYREPGGAGVRTDGSGYAGLTPPPFFDPLLAKVIGRAKTLADALDVTRRAIERFHIDGLPTNLGSLAAILEADELGAADARTTMLAERPDLVDTTTPDAPLGELLGAVAGSAAAATATGPAIEPAVVAPGQHAVICPGAGTIIDIAVAVGDSVSAGAPLFVLSAMKMETVVAAPASGTVRSLAAVGIGDQVHADDVLAALEATDSAQANGSGGSPWQDTLDQVSTLQRLAEERLGPDSQERGVVRQRSRNKLTCRERIDVLLDEGSFREVGSTAGFASYDEHGNITAFTPANSVGGTGTIEGRPAVVCADDFTSRGGHSDGAIAAKSVYLDQLSVELRVPSIRLLDGSSGGGSVASMVPEQKAKGESNAKESSGAIEAGKPRVSGGGGSFLPGHLGSTEYTRQLAEVPVVNVLLGSVVGLGAAKAVLGHFSVMVRDISQLFVAGPPVVSHAMGVDITKEELGGWEIHARNGSVDNLAETEDEAMEMTRRFLSYLPPSVFDAPPRVEPTDDPNRREDELSWLIPRKRTTTFDIRRAITLIADLDSFFEIGTHWGTDQVTGFARLNGHPVGVIASDSRHINGGALTADGCDKLTRHLDLCDLFHLPVVNLVDNPGFAVGIEHEITSTIRRGATWMVAFAQTKVPIFTVLMRRSFGVAGNNYATPRREFNNRVVWPAADTGGIPPEGGIEAAYKRQLAEAEDPVALRAELEARIESVRGPLGPLSRFQIEEMIDPLDTRPLLCEWVANAARIASSADNLGPRPLGYRP